MALGRIRHLAPAFGIPLGLAIGGAFVWQASYSAFTDTTTNGTNTWAAGNVKFDVNSPATALWTVTGAKPGSTDTKCIKITYIGTLQATAKTYLKTTDVGGTGLAPYLTWVVDQGTGNASDCSDFSGGTNIYNPTGVTDTTKTLTTFASSTNGFTNGLGAWTATTNATKTYRITWKLQDDNLAQGLTASATLTWEAQNT